MKLSEAKKITLSLVIRLQPHCEKIYVAGSIRREKQDVKDIELVVMPKKIFVQDDLFGDGHDEIVKEFDVAIGKIAKTIIKGKSNGRYMQIALHEGINLDLFIPAPNDYYRQLAIRTGSSDYAHYVIATAWKRLGWCGSDKGFRRTVDCVEQISAGKKSYKCINAQGDLPPNWQSEKEFFDWLKIPLLPPTQREYHYKPPLNLAQ